MICSREWGKSMYKLRWKWTRYVTFFFFFYDTLLLTYITFFSSLSRLCDYNSRSLSLITWYLWISSNLIVNQNSQSVNNPNHSNCTKTSMYHCIYMRLFRTVFLFFSFVEINSRGGKMTVNVINEKQWLSIYEFQ